MFSCQKAEKRSETTLEASDPESTSEEVRLKIVKPLFGIWKICLPQLSFMKFSTHAAEALCHVSR